MLMPTATNCGGIESNKMRSESILLADENVILVQSRVNEEHIQNVIHHIQSTGAKNIKAIASQSQPPDLVLIDEAHEILDSNTIIRGLLG